MHDYGKLIVDKIPAADTSALSKVKVSNATWNVSDVAGGKKVSLKDDHHLLGWADRQHQGRPDRRFTDRESDGQA